MKLNDTTTSFYLPLLNNFTRIDLKTVILMYKRDGVGFYALLDDQGKLIGYRWDDEAPVELQC